MKNRTTLWILVSLALLGLLCGWLLARRASPSSSSRDDARTASAEDDDTRGSVNARGGALPNTRDGKPNAANSGDPPLPVLDRQKRDELRAAVWRSLGRDLPDAAPAKTAYVLPEVPPWPDDPGDDSGRAGIDPQYVQDRVHNEFFPLARKCYGDMSDRIPDAGGRVVLAFDIVGNQNIGGIVEQVDVLDKSTLRDPEFIDCMRQSFLSVTFPPPEGGGMVTVEYPIVFSPGDDDE